MAEHCPLRLRRALLRNAQDAATDDGIPEWIPDPTLVAKAATPPPAALGSTRRPRQYKRHPIWIALDSAQWNAERWRAFVALVEEDGLDLEGESSLDALIAASDRRLAAARRAEDALEQQERREQRAAENAARRQQAGLPSYAGQPRRSIPRGLRSVRGLTLADFPELVAQLDPAKNDAIEPATLRAGSHTTIAWLCRAHEADGHLHEWQSELRSRTVRGTGCPYCLNRAVCQSNSLAALYPDMAAEWHPTKNGPITPGDVLPRAANRYWWVCPDGHEYELAPERRTGEDRGCQRCARQRSDSGGRQKLTERRPHLRRLSQLGPVPIVDSARLDEEPF